MNTRTGLIAVIAAIVLGASGAQAVTYDINTQTYGTVGTPADFTQPGSGLITSGASIQGVASNVYGALAAGSTIIFSYNLSTFVSPAIEIISSGSSTSAVFAGAPPASFNTGVVSALAFITGSTGTIIFQNLTKGTVEDFEAEVLGNTEVGFAGTGSTVTVSGVPLPASLPLFLTGALLLAGLGMYKRKQMSI